MTGDHPTEVHRRRQEAERLELLTELADLNEALEDDHGAKVTETVARAQHLPVRHLKSVVERTRERLAILNQQ